MLNVSAKSTDFDLTTTGALKQRLFGSTASTEASDAVLSSIIRAASRWAEGFVGYPLALQSYEELLPTYGTRLLSPFAATWYAFDWMPIVDGVDEFRQRTHPITPAAGGGWLGE